MPMMTLAIASVLNRKKVKAMSDKKKVPIQLFAVQMRVSRIQQDMKELEKELDELEEALLGDKNES
jgi:hypothetical protein